MGDRRYPIRITAGDIAVVGSVCVSLDSIVDYIEMQPDHVSLRPVTESGGIMSQRELVGFDLVAEPVPSTMTRSTRAQIEIDGIDADDLVNVLLPHIAKLVDDDHTIGALRGELRTAAEDVLVHIARQPRWTS